jgi:ZIP family zinc transporter
MSEAFLWGLLSASSLLLGGLAALRFRIESRLLGLVMAFGAGVLISAVAYELVDEAFTTSASGAGIPLGLTAGALAFFAGDALIDRLGGDDRKSMGGEQAAGSPLAIVLGIVLDGVPESVVIGLTILHGGAVSAAMVVAVFLSNLPEAVAATTGLAAAGWRPRSVLFLWTGVVLVSALAALAGYALFGDASPRTIAFVLSFAAGAILTMLADTMMPEAFRAGRQAGRARHDARLRGRVRRVGPRVAGSDGPKATRAGALWRPSGRPQKDGAPRGSADQCLRPAAARPPRATPLPELWAR